jgi:hypothetical protein
MFASVFAAATLMLAQGAASAEPATQQSAPAAQQTAQAKAKPEMKRVCSKIQNAENSHAPQKHCWMEPVKTASSEEVETAEAKQPN